MGTLFLVRHGQASFGADNYDQLSPLGHEQGVRLGRYWARTGQGPQAVLTGTLQRQRQTWAAIREGLGPAAAELQAVECDCLNEYDSEAEARRENLGQIGVKNGSALGC
jgi:phosphohistidine phosphatase SixA